MVQVREPGKIESLELIGGSQVAHPSPNLYLYSFNLSGGRCPHLGHLGDFICGPKTFPARLADLRGPKLILSLTSEQDPGAKLSGIFSSTTPNPANFSKEGEQEEPSPPTPAALFLDPTDGWLIRTIEASGEKKPTPITEAAWPQIPLPELPQHLSTVGPTFIWRQNPQPSSNPAKTLVKYFSGKKLRTIVLGDSPEDLEPLATTPGAVYLGPALAGEPLEAVSIYTLAEKARVDKEQQLSTLRENQNQWHSREASLKAGLAQWRDFEELKHRFAELKQEVETLNPTWVQAREKVEQARQSWAQAQINLKKSSQYLLGLRAKEPDKVMVTLEKYRRDDLEAAEAEVVRVRAEELKCLEEAQRLDTRLRQATQESEKYWVPKNEIQKNLTDLKKEMDKPGISLTDLMASPVPQPEDFIPEASLILTLVGDVMELGLPHNASKLEAIVVVCSRPPDQLGRQYLLALSRLPRYLVILGDFTFWPPWNGGSIPQSPSSKEPAWVNCIVAEEASLYKKFLAEGELFNPQQELPDSGPHLARLELAPELSPEAKANSNADLAADLDAINLDNANLAAINLDNANLAAINLDDADLAAINLGDAGLDLGDANLDDAGLDLDGLDLDGLNLDSIDLDIDLDIDLADVSPDKNPKNMPTAQNPEAGTEAGDGTETGDEDGDETGDGDGDGEIIPKDKFQQNLNLGMGLRAQGEIGPVNPASALATAQAALKFTLKENLPGPSVIIMTASASQGRLIELMLQDLQAPPDKIFVGEPHLFHHWPQVPLVIVEPAFEAPHRGHPWAWPSYGRPKLARAWNLAKDHIWLVGRDKWIAQLDNESPLATLWSRAETNVPSSYLSNEVTDQNFDFKEVLGAAKKSIWAVLPALSPAWWPSVEEYFLDAAIRRQAQITILMAPPTIETDPKYTEQAINILSAAGCIVTLAVGFPGIMTVVDDTCLSWGHLIENQTAEEEGSGPSFEVKLMASTKLPAAVPEINKIIQIDLIKQKIGGRRSGLKNCPQCGWPLIVTNQESPRGFNDDQPLKLDCLGHCQGKRGLRTLRSLDQRDAFSTPPVCGKDHQTRYHRVKKGRYTSWVCPNHPSGPNCPSYRVLPDDTQEGLSES